MLRKRKDKVVTTILVFSSLIHLAPSSVPPFPPLPFHVVVYPGILPDPSREVDGFLVKELLDSEVVRYFERGGAGGGEEERRSWNG